MSSEFTLTNLLIKLVPGFKRGKRLKWFDSMQQKHHLNVALANMSLAFCIRHHLAILQDLQKRFKLLLLVVQKSKNSKDTHAQLLYDGRHAIVDEAAPLHCFVLKSKHQLRGYTNTIDQLPSLKIGWKKNKRNQNTQPLSTILGFNNEALPDPQTKEELIAFLHRYGNPQTKIIVYFALAGNDQHNHLWYQTPQTNITNILQVYAFTGRNYELVYSCKKNICVKPPKDIAQEYEQYKQLCDEVEDQHHQESDPYQSNRAASVCLTRSGLNLAYDLGLIRQKDEWYALSYLLAKTHCSLYVFLDDQSHLRSITYSDVELSFTASVPCCENDCQDFDGLLEPWLQKEEQVRRQKASSIMLSFWQKVWRRRQEWVDQRKKILGPLVQLLEQLTLQNQTKSLHSPYLTCLTNVNKMIQHQRAYMYCSQDTGLHSIKFYLSDFAYQTFKKCRGVAVKATSDSTLTMLSVFGFTVVNLHTYFDCKMDQDFFNTTLSSEPQPGEVFISHHQKDLYKHHCAFMPDHPKTLHMYCKQRGQERSRYILQYWTQFGLSLLTTFGHDIHGQSTYPSASYLSFQCVWAAYANMSGPLSHAIEKTKKYYEKLIRRVSKGGFMFSIEEALEQHGPLDKDLSLPAQSIAEMDLVSAYGYSASKALMPTGFATGFKSFCTNDPKHCHLERLDAMARHQSFEYRAVYKTIHDMMQFPNIQIRTVYSNYSPLGLFYLGSYPIDLVVITTTGHVFLFQMDGAWCHGCPTCPPLGRYINGKTWQQVRTLTNKRDDKTRQWVNQINTRLNNKSLVSYAIIQDCCTPGYTPKELDNAFQTIPALASLVKGYHITDKCGKTLTWTHLEKLLDTHRDPDYTFIAYAHVHLDLLPHEQAPLIVYEMRDDKYAKQSLSTQGQVILTRNYYQWLKQMFGSRICVNVMDWILFYATEPCWNNLYTLLTQLRSSTQDPVLVSYLKRMINLGCGFFGARTSQKDKSSYRLVNALPANYAFYLHTPDINYTMDIGSNAYFLLATRPRPKLCQFVKPTNTALPMFLTIIEYGKLRLVQILHFIQQHVYPHYFKLLYSNVDNLIYSLARVDTLQEAVRPEALMSYDQNKDLFLASGAKQPGLAKLEWIRNGDCGWKFISLRTQHYCVIISEQQHNMNLHKTAGWTGLSSWEAYTMSKSILEGQQLCLIQNRRINKIANVNTHPVKFMY